MINLKTFRIIQVILRYPFAAHVSALKQKMGYAPPRVSLNRLYCYPNKIKFL